jgi:hypothetical protein
VDNGNPERKQETIRKELMTIGHQATRQQPESEGALFSDALKRAELSADPFIIRGNLEKAKQDACRKERVSPVIVGANQPQDVEIINIPSGMEVPTLAQQIRNLDPLLQADFKKKIFVKSALPGTGLKG